MLDELQLPRAREQVAHGGTRAGRRAAAAFSVAMGILVPSRYKSHKPCDHRYMEPEEVGHVVVLALVGEPRSINWRVDGFRPRSM
jgi:hypothetical protein